MSTIIDDTTNEGTLESERPGLSEMASRAAEGGLRFGVRAPQAMRSIVEESGPEDRPRSGRAAGMSQKVGTLGFEPRTSCTPCKLTHFFAFRYISLDNWK